MSTLSKFAVIHSLPDMTEEEAGQVLEAAWAMPDVVLSTTFANFDTGRVVCIWDAPDANDVENALKELEVPFEELSEVTEYPRPAG